MWRLCLSCPDYLRKVWSNLAVDKSEAPLLFVTGGPGVGKSRVLVQLAKWLPELVGRIWCTHESDAAGGVGGQVGAGDGPGDAPGRRASTSAAGASAGAGAALWTTKDACTAPPVVVAMIKAANGTSVIEGVEDGLSGSQVLAHRLLHRLFTPLVDFRTFVGDCVRAGVHFADALAVISRALNFAGRGRDFTLVLLVDEVQVLCTTRVVSERKEDGAGAGAGAGAGTGAGAGASEELRKKPYVHLIVVFSVCYYISVNVRLFCCVC